MGWDDSDEDEEWDADDLEAKLEAQLKEKKRQMRREEGLSSESEKEEEVKAAKPKPKPKPKPKAKAEPEKQLTAEERKLLQRKQEEERDAQLAGDLFSGFEKKQDPEDKRKAEAAKAEEDRKKKEEASKPKIVIEDAFDKVQLNLQADIESLVQKCIDKLDGGKVIKGQSIYCTNLLKLLEALLSKKELDEVEKVIAEIVKIKKQQKGAALAKDNKANTKLSKTTKFNANSEWEEVYGGGEGDEDWTQEEWDDWYAQQEGGGASAPARHSGAKW